MSTQKTALITGAEQAGIGREIARQLAHKGYSVWLGCRDADRGQQAATDLRKEGLDAHALALDVTVDASVKAAAQTFGKTRDTLDVLVNNAGVATGGYVSPTEASLDDMRAVYEVNVFGAVRVTQAFVPFLRKAGQGRIVMMSSSLGSIGEQLDMTSGTYGVNLLGYNSSKSALNMITDVLRQGACGARHQGQRREPRLRGDGSEQPSGSSHRRTRRGHRHSSRHARPDGPERWLLQRRHGSHDWAACLVNPIRDEFLEILLRLLDSNQRPQH